MTTLDPPGYGRPHPELAAPAEWPDGTYAIASGGRTVSVMVREDSRDNPADPHRWRKVEGNGRWLTWAELTSTASLQRLYTQHELGAAAAVLAARRGTRDDPTVQARTRTHPLATGGSPAGLPIEYRWLPPGPKTRLRGGDLKLLTAIGDGRALVYGSHQIAAVDHPSLTVRRGDLYIAAPALTTRRQLWAAGLTGAVDQRVARLYQAGLVARGGNRHWPAGGPPHEALPYRLTDAGLNTVTRARSYGGQPLRWTAEQLATDGRRLNQPAAAGTARVAAPDGRAAASGAHRADRGRGVGNVSGPGAVVAASPRSALPPGSAHSTSRPGIRTVSSVSTARTAKPSDSRRAPDGNSRAADGGGPNATWMTHGR